MLSIAKMAVGQEAYYLSQVAGAGHEYYAERGEAPGRWVGSGSGDLDLARRVGPEDLASVLAGLDPRSGERLGAANRRVPGFDLTFSAPKSVSLLWALADEHVGRKIVAAHEAAVAEVLGYLEREATVGRRGRDGVFQIAGSGLVGAAIRHSTSRAGDPQLHTHVLVANLVRGEDGRWGALDGRLLYRHARTGGFLYQAALRRHLTERLGVAWQPAGRGMAEMADWDRPVLRVFSRRRAQIEARLAAVGARSAKAAEVANLATRPPKELGVSLAELRAEWRERAGRLGFDRRRVRTLTAGPRPARALVVDAEAVGRAVVDEDSTFARRDVLRVIAEAAPDGASVADVEAAADAWLGREGASVMVGVTDFGEVRSTTPALLADEDLILAAAAAPPTGAGTVASRSVAAAVAANPHLGDDQRAAVTVLCSSGRALEVVVGPAGSGKTAMLAAARAAWHESGRTVIGAALAARAADELADGAGIRATTLTRLLTELERRPLEFGSVVVLDEAGMVGTRALAHLVRHTTAAGAKLVLVGDPMQLPEIHAGGAFARLAAAPTSVRLTENRRQRDPVERQAVAELRAGNVERALELLDGHGHLRRQVATLDGTIQVMAEAAGRRHLRGEDALMVAPLRWQVDELNATVRAFLQRVRRLPADQLVVNGVGYSVGDRVVCLRNDRRLGVTNGTRGTITRIGRRGDLTVAVSRHRRVRLSHGYLEDGHVAHGYATTIHKAQGATVDHLLVLATEDLGQQGGYTAITRGRDTNEIYAVRDPEPAPPKLPQHERDRLREALERDQRKTLARDTSPGLGR